MKLISLTMRNFMPYYGEVNLTFPDSADRNVMVVLGDNMRGKTSLLNAIRWTFYGKALGRHGREISVQDLVNKDAASEGDWQVECSIVFQGGGSTYELRRRATKRPLVARPGRAEDFEILRALKRDSLVLGDHLVDAEINRFAPEQISRFFLFDGELLQEYESLLIEGSEQGKRIKESIEQALGVPALMNGRVDAQTVLKTAQKLQSKELERTAGLERQAARQAELQTLIAAREGDVAQLAARLERIKAERVELDDFVDANEALHAAKGLLDAKRSEQRECLRRSKELAERRLTLLADSWREILRPQITVAREHLSQQYGVLSAGINRRTTLAERKRKLDESLSRARCDMCGQMLDSDHRAAISRELGEIEAELLSARVDDSSQAELLSRMKEVDRLLRPTGVEELRSVQSGLARVLVDDTRLESEIETLERQLAGRDTAEIARKRAIRDGLVREEGRLEQQLVEGERVVDGLRKDLAMLSRALEGNPLARTTRSSLLVRMADALERAFGQSIGDLREDLKHKVETLASEAFRRLTTQDKYAGLRINSNYGLAILDELGGEVSVRSAGAEQIVALSLIDGLARAGRSAGPVVMDTPFGRLDPKHRSNILNYLPANNQQLILLVHEGEFNVATDLPVIAERVGRFYQIQSASPRRSTLVRVTR